MPATNSNQLYVSQQRITGIFNILGNKRRDEVPPEFPGDVLVQWDTDNQNNLLPEMYRRWDEPPNEFRYFVEHVVQAIRPNENKFHEQKSHWRLSEIFTVSDEAFALVILLNEYHCWDGKGHLDKRFVSAKSGNKQGWSVAGLNAYTTLCAEVKRRRLEEGSKKLEKIMMSEYATGKTNAKGRSGATEIQSLNSDYEDDDENQLLDVIRRQQELEKNNDIDNELYND